LKIEEYVMLFFIVAISFFSGMFTYTLNPPENVEDMEHWECSRWEERVFYDCPRQCQEFNKTVCVEEHLVRRIR